MAELVDAQASGACGGNSVPVRLRLSAPAFAPEELRLAWPVLKVEKLTSINDAMVRHLVRRSNEGGSF